MALTREWVERKIVRLENEIGGRARDGLSSVEQENAIDLCRHWLATEQYARDAARYQFIREGRPGTYNDILKWAGAVLDRAIDAAMTQKESTT